MKKRQKILAFALAIILFIYNNGNIAWANDNRTVETSASIVSEENLVVHGTNSFGSLFTDVLDAELDEQEENDGCNIFSVEMHDTVAVVSFESICDATIVVAIYDDAGISLYAIGSLEVMSEESIAYVEVDTDIMPEYFYIKAFLIDEETMRPLCSAYSSSMYTEEMQLFLSKTTDDFDKDKVLNFDDDKTNNFAVFGDETIIIPESNGKNIVTTNDVTNNTYVIENIDDSVSSLESGNIFAYKYGEEDILIVKVDNISINGTTATIIGADTSMEEVFDYVKIDTTSKTQDIIVDESTCGEGVIYEGDVEVEGEVDNPQTYAVDMEAEKSIVKKFSLLEIKLKGGTKISGNIKLKLDASLKFYISDSQKYLEVKIDYKAIADVSVSGKTDREFIHLAEFEVSPVVGVYIRYKPAIVVEMSAKIELNAQLYGTIGFRASLENGMKDLTTTPEFKTELTGKISVFIGLSMKPQVVIATDKLANAELDITIGGVIEGKNAKVEADFKKLHACNSCVDGDIKAELSFKFEANILDSERLSFEIEKKFSYKITDFYISFDYGESGLTVCPYYKYKVTFTFLNKIGEVIPNSTIWAEDKEITVRMEDGTTEMVKELISKENGKAEGYLPAGKYKMLIEAEGYVSSSQELEIKDNSVSVIIWLKTPNEEELENDSSKIVGKNFDMGYTHTGVITEDGSLYMWGENTCGQIGNGNQENQTEPVKVMDNVVAISIESDTTAAITSDGSLYMWGENTYGQIGNGSQDDQLVPIKILENVASIYLEFGHSAAITQDGSLYMWGINTCGQIGNGTEGNNQLTPVKVLDGVVSVSLGSTHSGAITKDGSLYMWGDSIGVGNGMMTKNQLTPIKILEDVEVLSLGTSHSGAVTKDGSLYMWGMNVYGEVGDGSGALAIYNPVKILEGVEGISLHHYGSSAVAKDGSLYMWGLNDEGQIGNGNKDNQLVPINVLDNIESVLLSDSFSGAVTKDGSLYMWGYRIGIGVGNSTNQLTPAKVMDNVVLAESSLNHSGAVTNDGNLYMWGANGAGQVGNGVVSNYQKTPIKVLSNVKLPVMDKRVEFQQLKQGTSYIRYTTRIALHQEEYTDLTPNMIYNFYVMENKSAQNPFSSDNLLYITQAVSDQYGNLNIIYEPTQVIDDADVFVVQMSKVDLTSAQLELEDLQYTGEVQYVHPTVTLNNTILKEGEDYELIGDYSALEAGKYEVIIHGIGLYTGEIKVSYKVLGDVQFGTVGGRINSASISEIDDDITVELLNNTGVVECMITIGGDCTDYLFNYVEVGTYTLRISKKNHVTREYVVKIGDNDIIQDVRVCLLGDVNSDDEVTDEDYSCLLAHVKKLTVITDPYALLCADVTKDGKITMADYSRLLAHVEKVSPLW